jgi:cystathionine gamma-synthase
VIPGRTRLLMLEAPTNPHLRVADLQALAEWKRTVKGLRMVVDATLATPYNMKPLELGADIVVQSATKFLGGHNDLLAGSVAGRVGLMQAVRDVRGRTGAVADPHSAYLLVRGIKSLAPRMRQHNESALNIASYLESCPQIKRAWYPGLASHPDFHMASRLLGGFGGLLSFEHTGDLEFTRVFCNSLKLVQLAASLGGVESLCHPPALFSYWDLPRTEREQLGMPDSLIRLSVGLESADDIKADLTQALEKAAMATA